MRQRYERDLENNRAKQQKRYKRALENNRIKKRCQYKKTLIKQREQKRARYFINAERDRQRQRELPFDRKWQINKQYYQKRKSLLAKKNHDVGKNIIKKYVQFWSKNSIKIRVSSTKFLKNILE